MLEALTKTSVMKLEGSWTELTMEAVRMPEAPTRIAATKQGLRPKGLATMLVKKQKAIERELTMVAGMTMPLMVLLSYQEAQAVAIRHL
jgi:hypothetical protein